MFTSDFDFNLPAELIAQSPAPHRDQSRLLVLNRDSAAIAHRHFRDLLDYLRPGDVLVLNNSRVIPARLRGLNSHTGGQFEILLLDEVSQNDWWVMMRPGKRARVGTRIIIRSPRVQLSTKSGSVLPLPKGEGRGEGERDVHQSEPPEKGDYVHALVIQTNNEGHRRLRFECPQNILTLLDHLGEVPLPPYINRSIPNETESDRTCYQTVFAQPPGSVAAPTAGLHFTESFLDEIRSHNVHVCFLTLHVGLGTFAPVKTQTLSAHKMHQERFYLPESTARIINEAKRDHRRVIAVGTTTLRVLESVVAQNLRDAHLPLPVPRGEGRGEGLSSVTPAPGRTRIFIYPPYNFKIVDALLTNFHLPRSTLLMLVSAFAAPNETRGRDLILSAYAQAIKQRYRFFSYGDAMLIL